MPELKQLNLSYGRRKIRYANDLPVDVCAWLLSAFQSNSSNSRRVYKASDQEILYLMTLWLVRS